MEHPTFNFCKPNRSDSFFTGSTIAFFLEDPTNLDPVLTLDQDGKCTLGTREGRTYHDDVEAAWDFVYGRRGWTKRPAETTFEVTPPGGYAWTGTLRGLFTDSKHAVRGWSFQESPEGIKASQQGKDLGTFVSWTELFGELFRPKGWTLSVAKLYHRQGSGPDYAASPWWSVGMTDDLIKKYPRVPRPKVEVEPKVEVPKVETPVKEADDPPQVETPAPHVEPPDLVSEEDVPNVESPPDEVGRVGLVSLVVSLLTISELSHADDAKSARSTFLLRLLEKRIANDPVAVELLGAYKDSL